MRFVQKNRLNRLRVSFFSRLIRWFRCLRVDLFFFFYFFFWNSLSLVSLILVRNRRLHFSLFFFFIHFFCSFISRRSWDFNFHKKRLIQLHKMTTAAELITILGSVNVEDSQHVVGYLLFLFVFRRPLFFFLLVSFSSAANNW